MALRQPCVHMSRAPRSTIEVPRVATNAGTFLLVTSTPLKKPTTAPKTSARTVTGRNRESLPAMNVAAKTFDVEMTSATDRSSPPPMMTTVWPMAAMPSIEKPRAMLRILVALKKLTPVEM